MCALPPTSTRAPVRFTALGARLVIGPHLRSTPGTPGIHPAGALPPGVPGVEKASPVPIFTCSTVPPMTYERLRDFVENRMRMSHVYQPVMLLALLRGGGEAKTGEIARAILAHDVSADVRALGVDYIVPRSKGSAYARTDLIMHGVTRKQAQRSADRSVAQGRDRRDPSRTVSKPPRRLTILPFSQKNRRSTVPGKIAPFHFGTVSRERAVR